jgi:hypothetical protein
MRGALGFIQGVEPAIPTGFPAFHESRLRRDQGHSLPHFVQFIIHRYPSTEATSNATEKKIVQRIQELRNKYNLLQYHSCDRCNKRKRKFQEFKPENCKQSVSFLIVVTDDIVRKEKKRNTKWTVESTLTGNTDWEYWEHLDVREKQ